MPKQSHLNVVPFDPWAVCDDDEITDDDKGYSRDKVYTGSAGSAKLELRVSEAIISKLQQYREASAWPEYKTMADVARDALYHHFKYRDQQTLDTNRDTSLDLQVEYETALREDMVLRRTEHLERSRNVCMSLKNAGDTEELARYLTELRVYAMKIQEPWQSKVFRTVQEFQ